MLDVPFRSARQLAADIRRKKIGCLELLDLYLARGAKLMPRMIVGFTDAPYFRERGAVAYGFGLFSRALTAEAMAGRFHGNDERVDVDSLALTTQAWLEVCEQFLG